MSARKHFPKGVVRETRQWSPGFDDTVLIRYDFAFVDPASGARAQLCSECYIRKDMTEAEVNEMVLGPALAVLERMIHRKCGMDQALAHYIPLDLPRTVPARYV